MTVRHKSCEHTEYNSPLQLFRCTYEGDCEKKINAGSCFNCSLAVVKSREEFLKYEFEAYVQESRIREKSPKQAMPALAESRSF